MASESETKTEGTTKKPLRKRSWRRIAAFGVGLMGLIATMDSIIATISRWTSAPEPSLSTIAAQQEQIATQQEQLAQQQQQIATAVKEPDDTHRVAEVSRRITEVGDQYQRIVGRLTDARRLDASLTAEPDDSKILTPTQQKMLEASRKKEREELRAILVETDKMARELLAATEADKVLSAAPAGGTEGAQARALSQVEELKRRLLPEIETLAARHSP